MPATPILKKQAPAASSACKRVVFNTSQTIHSIILKFRESGDSSHFSSLFNDLSTSGSKSELLLWLSQMTECVPLLDRQADKIVLQFLKIPWYKSKELAAAAKSFVITLVTAHNYYTYSVLKQLFTSLIPDVNEDDESLLVKAGLLTEEKEVCQQLILTSIVAIHNHVPMCRDTLLVLARKCMPYFRRHVHQHAVYTFNLLQLANQLPRLRMALLEIVITNMVTIDVHIPRSELATLDEDDDDDSSEEEDVFDMEVDEPKEKEGKVASESSCAMNHKDGNTLDVLMAIMLQYVHDVCHGFNEPRKPTVLSENSADVKSTPQIRDSKQLCQAGSVSLSGNDNSLTVGCECGGREHDLAALKLLFTDLKEVFSSIILRTFASCHVQFLVFYLLALRPGLATIFLEFLRVKQFENPNCSRDVRQNAMAYIGSLLARGKFIPFSHVHSCLEEMMRATNYEDFLLHSPFYYACQTVFYVFTFRYREYTKDSKRLALARSLNLERLVMSQLNPLRICAPPVVSNFAAVTRRFQLAYCYTIMENNKRFGIPAASVDEHRCAGNTTLNMLFPFDPYLLQRSKIYIEDHYREFDGLPEDVVKSQETTMDTDAQDIIVTPKSFDFSYGSSPGYRKWQGGFLPSDHLVEGVFPL
ncbi:RNA polymerase I-specific transcription initiation factor RRN3-like [Homarus americanus]|uniref:RNA polymerase I-specific transcription initiation factor RRN3-like n=1 Tax=Homarus americanus TaxID=6706 RepID=A0A8J5MPI9_HOMAM|nr:RNA polymerase I-specific transcription initiation factor RRN3-like [Homarus americanus]